MRDIEEPSASVFQELDVDVDVDVVPAEDLGDGAELLDTAEMSPEEIVGLFAQPS